VKIVEMAGVMIAVVGFLAIVVVWAMRWRKETERRFKDLIKITRDTYLLSNSHMAEQLHLNVTLTSRVAELTGNQNDIEQAEVSKRKYDEHQSRQSIVDFGVDAERRVAPKGVRP
jgi:hypothetical protein